MSSLSKLGIRKAEDFFLAKTRELPSRNGASNTRAQHEDSSGNLEWRFPKIGVPPNHPFFFGLSTMNYLFWGTPMYGNTHILKIQILPSKNRSYHKQFLFLGTSTIIPGIRVKHWHPIRGIQGRSACHKTAGDHSNPSKFLSLSIMVSPFLTTSYLVQINQPAETSKHMLMLKSSNNASLFSIQHQLMNIQGFFRVAPLSKRG